MFRWCHRSLRNRPADLETLLTGHKRKGRSEDRPLVFSHVCSRLDEELSAVCRDCGTIDEA